MRNTGRFLAGGFPWNIENIVVNTSAAAFVMHAGGFTVVLLRFFSFLLSSIM